jgi:hypothetical protein
MTTRNSICKTTNPSTSTSTSVEEKKDRFLKINRPLTKALIQPADGLKALKHIKSLGIDLSEPGTAAFVKTMFDPSKVYRFRLALSSNLASPVSGPIATDISWDAGMFTDFSSYLSNLFDEIRLRSVRLQVVSTRPLAAIPSGIIIAPLQSLQVTPGTLNQVASVPGAKQLNPYSTSTEILNFNVPSDRPFNDCGTPSGSSTGIPSGTQGCWWCYGNLSPTASSNYWSYLLEEVVELRSRF